MTSLPLRVHPILSRWNSNSSMTSIDEPVSIHIHPYLAASPRHLCRRSRFHRHSLHHQHGFTIQQIVVCPHSRSPLIYLSPPIPLRLLGVRHLYLKVHLNSMEGDSDSL